MLLSSYIAIIIPSLHICPRDVPSHWIYNPIPQTHDIQQTYKHITQHFTVLHNKGPETQLCGPDNPPQGLKLVHRLIQVARLCGEAH